MHRQNSAQVRVRFAPSPTGVPHIGNTRTALFNFLFARHNGGKLILRIEDTDRERYVEDAEKAIKEILNWLGLTWDEEYTQSKRLDIYKDHAEILRKKGFAFEDEGALRFRMPKEGDTSWTDGVGDKEITFKNEIQEDFVIIKSDGYPTYNFANVIDDHLMNITHVIRGEEFISSTPKHVQLYKAFGWKQPIFVHLPVILGTDKAKLSKRHGAKSALDYREDGFLKEALLNFMALLGWNPGADREYMSIDEMIKLFELKDINVSNPIFDIKKLEWLNGVWIRSIDNLDQRLKDFYKDDQEIMKALSSDKSEVIIESSKSRMRTLSEFKELALQGLSREKTKEEMQKAEMLLKFLNLKLKDDWGDEKLLFALKDFSKTNETNFKSIYFLMTGKEKGIGILELNQIHGKEFFIKNLSNG
ncbi:MAG: glutamate--tRNA ligase family protein [Patescibacteria group bacterium]